MQKMFSIFKKDTFSYKNQEQFFTYNDEKIAFEDINAIFQKDIQHSTNGVYEKQELELTLDIKEKQILLKADTDDLDKYKELSELQGAIVEFRTQKLRNTYKQKDTIMFDLKNGEYKLLIEGKKLFVKFNKTKRPSSEDFEVKTMKQDGAMLELRGESKEEVSSLWFISDRDLFLKLASECVEYITPFDTMMKKMLLQAKIKKYALMLFIPFGLNGLSEYFFDTSLLRHSEPFHILSGIAGLFLWVVIITTPFYYFTNWVNGRKQQMQSDLLAGREPSVKPIDFSNFLLVALVVGLCVLVYEVYLK
jgi:hypothetical protein